MIISESIDQIIDKHKKTRLTYIFGVVPLIIILIFLFIYENQIVRIDKSFVTKVNTYTTPLRLYKLSAAKKERIKIIERAIRKTRLQ
jgi:hypothetical protein